MRQAARGGVQVAVSFTAYGAMHLFAQGNNAVAFSSRVCSPPRAGGRRTVVATHGLFAHPMEIQCGYC